MQCYATPVPKEIVLREIAMWHMVSSRSARRKANSAYSGIKLAWLALGIQHTANGA
jgi:hypothetical protein